MCKGLCQGDGITMRDQKGVALGKEMSDRKKKALGGWVKKIRAFSGFDHYNGVLWCFG